MVIFILHPILHFDVVILQWKYSFPKGLTNEMPYYWGILCDLFVDSRPSMFHRDQLSVSFHSPFFIDLHRTWHSKSEILSSLLDFKSVSKI